MIAVFWASPTRGCFAMFARIGTLIPSGITQCLVDQAFGFIVSGSLSGRVEIGIVAVQFAGVTVRICAIE